MQGVISHGPTETEQRNIATVYAWAEAWRLPGGSAEKMVDEVYADAPVFGAICAHGDMVAFEGHVEMLTKCGEKRGWPFAVFMTFDDDGRIVRDHTYMPDSPHGELFQEAARKAAD